MNTSTLEEYWADVIGFVGQYQISSKGNLLSLARTVPARNGTRSVRQQILRNRIIYKDKVVSAVTVKLSSPGTVSRTLTVPRLMLEAFYGVRGPLWVASPKDKNPENLDLDNWEWRRIGYTIHPGI